MSRVEDFLKRDIAFKSDFVETAKGGIDVIAGLDNLKESLFRRLITVPGGVIHRPDYGVGVKKYVGATNNIDNQRRLARTIKEQFELDPRVESVDGVSYSTVDNNPETVKINVRVSVVGYGETVMSFVPFGDV